MAYEQEILYNLSIASGDIDGLTSVNKSGRTTNLDSGSNDTDIWDGSIVSNDRIWEPPTAARIHDIDSSSANDTSAGTGMRTVRIFGLDASWNEITEDITLNGTTNVPTENAYIRIYRMFGLTWGSNRVNEGNITATAQTDGTVTAQINIDNNQTLMAIYTVPAGKTAYITQYYCSVNRNSPSNVSFDISLLVKNDADVSNMGYKTKHIQGMYINSNTLTHSFTPYVKVTEKSDIVMRGINCTDNNTDVSAGFDLILKDN